jgi:hypothetical protein
MQTLPPLPGTRASGFDPDCPYTRVLELAKKQLAHENSTLDFSIPEHAAALTRLAVEHHELRPRIFHAATLSVLRESNIPQVRFSMLCTTVYGGCKRQVLSVPLF